MRLICPNCGAQYEIPDEVIPESGRDVQCSNCGDTWFQHHPDHEPEPDLAEDFTDDQDWEEPAADEPDTEFWEEPSTPQPAASADRETEPEPEPEFETEDDPEFDPEPVAEPERARELDPAVANVLREEAEREKLARDADTRGTIETQQELGIDEHPADSDARSQQAKARMARLRGLPEDSEPETDDDIDPASRSNLLPDIDEINSSLSSGVTADETAGNTAPDDASASGAKGGGFRSGFRLAVIIVLLAVLVYVFAPKLAEAVPALANPLAAYVEAVNAGRVALSDWVSGLI